MKNKVFKYLLASYLPGLILVLLDILFSSRFVYTAWITMIAWNIYIFIILILVYILERRGT